MPDAMHKATLRARADTLREMVRREARLNRLYGKRLEVMQRKLRGASGARVTVRIEREMRKLVKEVVPEIQTAIRDATGAGAATGEEQLKAIFGKKDVLVPLTTTAERMSLASARIRGRLYVDKIPLSSRLWRNARATGDEMGRAIQTSIRAGNGMEKIAKEIIAKKPPAVRMPKYIDDLTTAARRASELNQPNLLDDVVKKYQTQIDKLGSKAGPLFDATTNTKRLVKDIKGATPKQIDEHVRRYMEEKARQHAITIARTETIHAYRDGYYKSIKDQPGVKGIRWNLAVSHPHADICDVFAGQDVDGLGPGGYKYENIPSNPHPNCMCYQTAVVDEHHFERKVAKKKGLPEPPKKWLSGKKETGAEWLAKQSKAKQLEVLGPTRQAMLEKHGSQVIHPKTGKIALVRDLQKRAR